jgi:hypothetical protein
MKELKFSHITKNAGTSIEKAARAQGINWGMYHMIGKEPRNDDQVSTYWHDPISNLPLDIRQKYDWFIVVRNPYDRIVSEFFCPWISHATKEYTVDEYNSIIQHCITNRLFFPQTRGKGHYMEQWRYLDPSVTVHVLKFESLAADFLTLMNNYGLKISLDTVCNRGRQKKFSRDDFSAKTIDMINTVYKMDFELFGYTMIPATIHTSTVKELKFSYINGSAATRIENSALNCGIKWGRFHMVGHTNHAIDEYSAHCCDPISRLPEELKQHYDWFIVVRNPYDRIIAEFLFHNPTYTNTVEEFNKALRRHIVNRSAVRRQYIEQWRYVDPTVTVHVLKFETLDQEFKTLMNKYGLTVSLNPVPTEHTRKYTANDLSAATIHIINTLYKLDFETFAYSYL